MPQPDDALEKRVARLQRVAYGADATEAERAAAEAELVALRASKDAREHAPGDATARDGRAEGPAPSASDAASASVVPADARPLRSQRSGRRAVLAYSAAALVAGAVIGWAVGSGIAPSEGSDVGVPVAETTAWEVFERPATDGDFVRHPGPLVDMGTDDSTRRLLLTRSDGVRLIAVQTKDGENACLILALPVGRPATACTEDGRFPREGLRAEISVQGVGVYLAGWKPDGQADINTASASTG
ncbi:hypothetical protein [Agromyces sp. ZXT2-6]|uniref:hypothetical protein n=1 Tax=Agromyces sp. ZXT2-6 TaxID=3461153 RepID=UPI004055052A